MSQRRGGIIQVKTNGVILDAKGSWTYGFGLPKKETIMGIDRPHGHKIGPSIGFIEGEVTDRRDLDVPAFLSAEDALVTMDLANGKTFILRNAVQVGEGTVGVEEGNIAVRFEGAAEETT